MVFSNSAKFFEPSVVFHDFKWPSKYCKKYEKFLSPNEPKNTCNEWCIAISIKYSLNLSTKIAPGNKQSDRSKTCLVFYGIQSSSEQHSMASFYHSKLTKSWQQQLLIIKTFCLVNGKFTFVFMRCLCLPKRVYRQHFIFQVDN